jgi:hypothetical protein
MKTLKIMIGIIIISMSVILLGCSANETIEEEEGDCCDNFVLPAMLIKFSQSEYKEYVIGQVQYSGYLGREYVSPLIYKKWDDLTQVAVKTAGPYIELPDTYLLIGPHCEGIIRAKDGNTVVLNWKWEDWAKDAPYPAGSILDIDLILDDDPSREMWVIYADSLQSFNGGILKYKRGSDIAMTPEAYAEYTEILSRMIEQGKIEEYGERWR